MPIPLFFKYLTYLIVSNVFLANLEIDLVIIKSNFPNSASTSIFKNPFLFKVDVPVIPLSE